MKIWIGGSSGLSETYFHNTSPTISDHNNSNDSATSIYDDDEDNVESWILIGCESTPPPWLARDVSSSISAPPNLKERKQRRRRYQYQYICCDLCQLTGHNDDAEIQRVMDDIRAAVVVADTAMTTNKRGSSNIDSVIVGIRPSLITNRTNDDALTYNERMVKGLEILLRRLLHHDDYSTTIQLILHISSIAAINHIATQHVRAIYNSSMDTSHNHNNIKDPSYTTLQHPYDRFKRQCEEMIEQLVQEVNATMTATNTTNSDQHNHRNSSSSSRSSRSRIVVQYTSVRLGAIFSDPSTCIQCQALWLQMIFCGPYLPTRIDCNSSYNVSQLIHEILQVSSLIARQRQSSSLSSSSSPSSYVVAQLRPVYYYTRCVSQYPYPVSYGEYLLSYRKSFGWVAWFLPILMPHFIIEYGVVRLMHRLTVLLQMICRRLPPYVESMDYLLQVTLNEHTFDMKETIKDFPNLLQLEETMERCFVRRRRRQQQQR